LRFLGAIPVTPVPTMAYDLSEENLLLLNFKGGPPLKHLLILLLITLVHGSALAQERIDGTFPFQSDPAKKYSLYIPSTYEEGTEHRMMIGFHPLNTARWDAESWCDTLIVFAEENDLLLACPDGGPDGRVDDPIDVAFTTALMDSMELWYDVDLDKVYAMGFSWGGRATYTYGLNHVERFGGFVPIGAAINGTNEVGGIIQNAAGKPYYLVHGANDSPGTRYFPILQALQDNDAIVNSILMPGVGHTIDFPNRNAILADAFQWVDSVNCAVDPSSIPALPTVLSRFAATPNPVSIGGELRLRGPDVGPATAELWNVAGKRVTAWSFDEAEAHFRLRDLPAGTYLLRIEDRQGVETQKITVR